MLHPGLSSAVAQFCTKRYGDELVSASLFMQMPGQHPDYATISLNLSNSAFVHHLPSKLLNMRD